MGGHTRPHAARGARAARNLARCAAVHRYGHGSHGDHTEAISLMCLFGFLVLGSFARQYGHHTGLPYTVLLLLIGRQNLVVT